MQLARMDPDYLVKGNVLVVHKILNLIFFGAIIDRDDNNLIARFDRIPIYAFEKLLDCLDEFGKADFKRIVVNHFTTVGWDQLGNAADRILLECDVQRPDLNADGNVCRFAKFNGDGAVAAMQISDVYFCVHCGLLRFDTLCTATSYCVPLKERV